MDLFSSVEQRQPGIAPDGGRLIDVDALEPGDEVEARGPEGGMVWWEVEFASKQGDKVVLTARRGDEAKIGVFLPGYRIWARAR